MTKLCRAELLFPVKTFLDCSCKSVPIVPSIDMITLTLFFSLFRLLLNLLRKLPAYITEGRHADARSIETTLFTFELFIRKFDLVQMVSDAVRETLASEKMGECVYAIDDFGQILCVVQVGRLEAEDVRQARVARKAKEDVDIVGSVHLMTDVLRIAIS